jgi:rhodanese-related sulfurtransferase
MAKTIRRDDVKRKIDRGDDFVLIEVLEPDAFREKHIKGAINIPLGRIGREARDRFDPEEEIVVYCADKACTASPKAAEKLENLGFKNVYDYEGGKADWDRAGYPMESGG